MDPFSRRAPHQPGPERGPDFWTPLTRSRNRNSPGQVPSLMVQQQAAHHREPGVGRMQQLLHLVLPTRLRVSKRRNLVPNGGKTGLLVGADILRNPTNKGSGCKAATEHLKEKGRQTSFMLKHISDEFNTETNHILRMRGRKADFHFISLEMMSDKPIDVFRNGMDKNVPESRK